MNKNALKNILFLDVETVSGESIFLDLPERIKDHWRSKAKIITSNKNLTEEETIECYHNKSAIYAEFNKIVCISVGYLDFSKNGVQLKVKSFAGHNEKSLLVDFKNLIAKHYNDPDINYLCGHNIREFDCPVICRRMLVNGIEHPKLLKLSRKKPWQLGHLLDTLEMWKFGDYKSYISLDLLAALMDVPSPKEDLNGSMVSAVYWQKKDLDRIKKYCQEDVVTTAKVFLKLILEDAFDKVNYVSN